MANAAGTFVWFDYIAPDIRRAQDFFGEVFHWKTQEVLGHGAPYTMIALGEQTIGGYVPTPPGSPPIGHWLSHLGVDDAAQTCARIVALGGKVWKEPAPMGEAGTVAIVADPQGGVFALWQSAKPATSGGDYKDLPGAWCWNELAAHDPIAATGFYTALGFEEEKIDVPGVAGAYFVLSSAGKARAGVMKTPMPDAPQAWMPYVQVTSVDATVATAQRLGAKIHEAPNDVPGIGRVAIFTDPQGGWLGVLAPEKR